MKSNLYHKEMDKRHEGELVDVQNMYINKAGHWQVREGYSSFIGLIKMLYRANKSNKRWKTKAKYTIILPVKWI